MKSIYIRKKDVPQKYKNFPEVVRRVRNYRDRLAIERIPVYSFPFPITIGRALYYREYELEAWIEYEAFKQKHEKELARYDSVYDVPHRIAETAIKASAGFSAYAEILRYIAEELNTEELSASDKEILKRQERDFREFLFRIEEDIKLTLQHYNILKQDGVNLSNDPF